MILGRDFSPHFSSVDCRRPSIIFFILFSTYVHIITCINHCSLRGHFQTIFKKLASWGGGLGLWHYFDMNIESSLSLSASWSLHSVQAVGAAEEYLQGSYERFIEHVLYVYLPLSSCPSMTISTSLVLWLSGVLLMDCISIIEVQSS